MRERDDLLAEVKRLREDLKVQREMHDVCLELHPESESCLAAEEKLTSLRQSHARLLAAVKFERNESGCWCDPPRKAGHTIGCSQLRAAVAEAEAL